MSTTAGFSAFSPSYENIANRMSRLKHHKSTQSLTQIRPNSARKLDLNMFATDSFNNSGFPPRRRVSPTNIAIDAGALTSTGDKFTGRVAKNTGIKKYNQRQFREIPDGKNVHVPLSTEPTYRKGCITPFAIENVSAYSGLKSMDEAKSKEQAEKMNKKGLDSLIPGRIYNR
jgi:hypothetical protein